MVEILILSHGELARELLVAAEVIAGTLHGFKALTLDWQDSADEVRRRIRAALEHVDQESGVLILTDMYGNTPSNVALSFAEAGKVAVVAGINLPMVVRLACCRNEDRSVEEIAAWIRDKGRGSICCGPTSAKAS